VGASLGSTNSVPFRFWIVAFDNASTVVLGLINCSAPTQVFPLDETGIQRSVAMTAGATSAGVFYTPNGTTVTSKAHRILGYLEYASGLATAGTYATAPTKVQLVGPGAKKPGAVVQTAYASNTRSTTATTNTQVQTGTTKTITPTNTISLIRVMAFGTLNDSTAAQYAIAQLSRGTGPTLIGTLTECFNTGGNTCCPASLMVLDSPAAASAVTYMLSAAPTVAATVSGMPTQP
jgi:hypothetical protein